ncbi:MAG: response regulator [Candidatus Omnitrophota bacterium]
MKILVIDDDTDMLLILSVSLKKILACDVIQSEGGLEALELAKSELPGAIIMDYVMEGMNGPALLELMRKEEKLKDTPVIFLTAMADSINAERLQAMGAKGVIGKPFNPLELPKMVQRILEE